MIKIANISEQLEILCDKSRHLICLPYSIDNLHKIAAILGIKRYWFHKGNWPHYDIPKRMEKRIFEIAYITDSKTILNIIRENYETSKK